MKTTTNYTWLEYMEALRSKYCNAAVYDPQLLNVFLNTNTLSSSFFSLTNPAVYILDYRCGRYLKMSGNFGEHPSEVFLNDGINKFVDVYDKQQFQVFNEQIFPDRLNILNTIDYREHTNYVFSGSLTIQNASGVPVNYLQRNFYLSDTDGHPLISIGIFIEMEHYHSGGQMWQTVHQLGSDGVMINPALFNKTYPISPCNNVFSKREKEVLLWMSNGLSSKMIAGKLFLSEHTVINHRRNMQDKTKSANAIALIKYAIENGAI
jgi:DNA-binding CsgD family transcriptional regulator